MAKKPSGGSDDIWNGGGNDDVWNGTNLAKAAAIVYHEQEAVEGSGMQALPCQMQCARA